MIRRALVLALLAALALPAGAFAEPASLLDVEDEVMCVTCNVPLNIAESPQADRQRAFIREQIAAGRDKRQVKTALVSEYGTDVLALPDEDGFGVTAYAIPVALFVLLAGGLLFLVSRWRGGVGRHGGPGGPGGLTAPATPALSPTDARRLDEDLARYDT